ncbi:hypothetical protein ATCC90586_001746 [Pythium insidiosum]|nr:hypothetical protein ATCC90586_001746 [Pythium insidiosum]
MLQVALPALRATPRRPPKKTLGDDDDGDAFAPLVLETRVVSPVALVEEEEEEERRDASVVAAEADAEAEAKAADEQEQSPLRWETEDEDDDANDSDYREEDEDEEDDEDDDDEDDEDAYRRSLEMELDEDADEVSDVYLKRMLEARDRVEGEDAAWVERYIQAQREWKEKHGTSIDEIDLDLRLARAKPPMDEAPERLPSLLQDAWLGRVSRCLPASLRQQPIELLVSTAAVGLFVALALGIQFYVAFRAPRPSVGANANVPKHEMVGASLIVLLFSAVMAVALHYTAAPFVFAKCMASCSAAVAQCYDGLGQAFRG